MKGKRNMAIKKGFMFTNRRHSHKAIMGTILGAVSMASLITVIALSYLKGGEVPAGYGFTGLFATVFSLTGLVLGITTVREKDKFRLFPLFAIVLNGLTLLIMGVLLYAAM